MESNNERAEATKTKISDMRLRLESLRKRKLEEAAQDVQLIGEQLNQSPDCEDSPTKKCRQTEEQDSSFSPQSPAPAAHRRGADDRIEVIDLDGAHSPQKMQPNARENHPPGARSDNPLVKIVFLDHKTAR